jgi:hypothetical protein
LTLVNLSYRPTPTLRFRLAAQRFRSTRFAASLFRDSTDLANPGGGIDLGDLDFPLNKDFNELATQHLAKLTAQFTVAKDYNVFVTGGARHRSIDGKVGPIFSVGVNAFHPVRLPVQGRVSYRYRKLGYSGESPQDNDVTDHTLQLKLWRKLSFTSPLTFGGGLGYVRSTRDLDPTIQIKVSPTSSLFTVNAFAEYDLNRFSVYAEYEAASPSDQEETNGTPETLEHLLILGVTMRFGQAARRFF